MENWKSTYSTFNHVFLVLLLQETAKCFSVNFCLVVFFPLKNVLTVVKCNVISTTTKTDHLLEDSRRGEIDINVVGMIWV